MGLIQRDQGLQPERTRLAWRRTVLVGAVISLLGIQVAHGHLLIIASVVVIWLLLMGVGFRRISALNVPRPQPLSPLSVLIVVGIVIALAALGIGAATS